MNTASDFYVTLPSNTHHGDKPEDYCIRLPGKLKLSGQWQVALTEISFPHTWNNISSTFDTTDPEMEYKNKILIALRQGDQLHCYVEPGYYGSPYELLVGVKRAIKTAIDTFITEEGGEEKLRLGGLDSVNISKFHKCVTAWHDNVSKRVKVGLSNDYVSWVVISRHIQYMLGLESNYMESWGDDPNPKVYTAKFPPDITGGLDSLYVYSDIVQPQIVGNTYAPLLRFCHITGGHGETVNTIFYAPYYIPVLVNEIDKIDIKIKTDTGIPVPFLFGNVICKLHFKKKRLTL